MKSMKVIKDPIAFQLLGDETRRRMIYLLRGKEYTVSQLASELSLTPQAIYHHIRKLKEVEMVEVAREERIEHFIETYYRASAELFQCMHGTSSCCKEDLEEKAKLIIDGLKSLGYEVAKDANMLSKMIEIEETKEELGTVPEIIDQIGGLEDVGFFEKQTLVEYTKLLLMSDEEFEKYQQQSKKLRDVLRANVKKSGKSKKS
ncbi:MAG: ArsR family transcriptional regulator [Methanomassiliicoccus sp.]|nr:MAG: ArsR family transcriptional regulator [Methanomassiliicoccus sp.]